MDRKMKLKEIVCLPRLADGSIGAREEAVLRITNGFSVIYVETTRRPEWHNDNEIDVRFNQLTLEEFDMRYLEVEV